MANPDQLRKALINLLGRDLRPTPKKSSTTRVGGKVVPSPKPTGKSVGEQKMQKIIDDLTKEF